MQACLENELLFKYIYLRTERTNLYFRVNDDSKYTIYADSISPTYSCIFEVIKTDKPNVISSHGLQ